MKPLDPRLLRHARSARHWVLLAAACQIGVAALVVVQALLLAGALAAVVSDGAPAASVVRPAALLVLVVAGRAGLAWVQERFAHRAATRVVGELRAAVLDRVTAAGPRALDGDNGPGLTTLVTRGLDALDGYLVRYLPQLLATAVVTPALLAVVLAHDLLSAVLMAVTLPLVPVLMALVGWSTQRFAERRLVRMQQLGSQLLDLVAGLPTLKALGRASQQAARVRTVGDAYRRATNVVLRQAFLSGLVLEVFTTLAVALVAVGVGLRLLRGEMDLQTGLAVLILAPEVYLPLRMVGQHFHASSDGIAAAAQAFSALELPTRSQAEATRPLSRVTGVRFENLSLRHDGRDLEAPYRLDDTVRAGRVTALVGANGAGKSTAVAALLGLRVPSAGRVLLRTGADEVDLADIDRQLWHRQVAWAPQRPVLVPGTVAENLRVVAPDATTEDLHAAARRVGLDEVIADLPAGWDTRIGGGGVGLSAGQRQRLALTRVLLRVADATAPAHVVVLDEPTAHLDPETEQVVLRTLRELADDGALVIVVAHRASLASVADDVIVVRARAMSPEEVAA
ncbi:MAG TPA: thiol reductant ABC exporter subunit CydD [Actinomycetales bacterium]|nr:thiol reductant ABC exporter subunit CydD [Actinomycetales bacterium]